MCQLRQSFFFGGCGQGWRLGWVIIRVNRRGNVSNFRRTRKFEHTINDATIRSFRKPRPVDMFKIIYRNMIEKKGLERSRVTIHPCLVTWKEGCAVLPDIRWKINDLIGPFSGIRTIRKPRIRIQVLLIYNLWVLWGDVKYHLHLKQVPHHSHVRSKSHETK